MRKRHRNRIVFAVVLALALAFADSFIHFSTIFASTYSLPGRARTVFLGDSITAFWHIPFADMINSGVSGNITEQMLNRFVSDVVDHHPQRVIILGGINDLRVDVPIEGIEANISAMIDLSEEHGIIPILCSILPVASWQSISRELAQIDPATDALNKWLRQQASTRGLLFIDYWRGFDPVLMTRDGLHPNVLGYRYMERAIEPLFADQPGAILPRIIRDTFTLI